MEETSPSHQAPHPKTLHNASAESLSNHSSPTNLNQPITSPTDTKTNVSSPPNKIASEESKVKCRNITKKNSRTDTESNARNASKVDESHAFIVSEQNVSRKGSKPKSSTTSSREPVTITDFPCSADMSPNSNKAHDLPILTSTVTSTSKMITTVSLPLTCISNQTSKSETVTSVLSNLPNISQEHSPVSITCRITQTPPTLRPISPNMRSPSNLKSSSNIGRPSLLPTSPHAAQGSRVGAVTSRPAAIATVSGGAVPEPTHAALHMAEPTQRKPKRRSRRPSPPARR